MGLAWLENNAVKDIVTFADCDGDWEDFATCRRTDFLKGGPIVWVPGQGSWPTHSIARAFSL